VARTESGGDGVSGGKMQGKGVGVEGRHVKGSLTMTDRVNLSGGGGFSGRRGR